MGGPRSGATGKVAIQAADPAALPRHDDPSALPGSHALPPADLSGPKTPGLDEPDHRPAGDPERVWRRRDRWLDAIMRDDLPTGPAVLAGSDAVALLDDAFAAAEWCLMAACPRVRAMAARQIKAYELIRAARTDADRRAINLGRELGVQPPAGKSPAFALSLARRNALLRHLWRTVPEWRDLPPRRAAVKIAAAFARYRATRWKAERDRESAPVAAEPWPSFWRLARLGRDDEATPPRPGLAVAMPAPDTLARLLAE